MKTLLSCTATAVVSLLAGGTAAAQEPGQTMQTAPAVQTLPAAQSAPAAQVAPQQLPVAQTVHRAMTVAGDSLGMPAAASPVPQASVPQTVAAVVGNATYYVDAPQMDRAERRRMQARQFAARIDSLVRSHRYLFRARTLRELPAGVEHRIYADFYYCALATDHVELHLPLEQGEVRYAETLNFDSMSVSDYRASRLQAGWNISFDIRQNDAVYHVDLTVSTLTGEAQLTLLAPHATMRYTGALQG